MKKLIHILCLLVPLAAQAQTRTQTVTNTIKITDTFWAKPDTYYLDSIEIDLKKVYLDPQNIKDVTVFENPLSKVVGGAKGAYFINRKISQPILTLADVWKKRAVKEKNSIKFIIDEKLIQDTTNVRLEVTAIKEIIFIKGTEGKDDHGFNSSPSIIIKTKSAQE